MLITIEPLLFFIGDSVFTTPLMLALEDGCATSLTSNSSSISRLAILDLQHTYIRTCSYLYCTPCDNGDFCCFCCCCCCYLLLVFPANRKSVSILFLLFLFSIALHEAFLRKAFLRMRIPSNKQLLASVLT